MGIYTKLAVSQVPEGTFSLVFSDATLGQQEDEGEGGSMGFSSQHTQKPSSHYLIFSSELPDITA